MATPNRTLSDTRAIRSRTLRPCCRQRLFTSKTRRSGLRKSLTLRGFIQNEFAGSLMGEFLKRATPWVREGRLKYREDIVDGLENAPGAFTGMLEGANFGKRLIRVS
jgi:NADPH-dependent curcumin reductase CurA